METHMTPRRVYDHQSWNIKPGKMSIFICENAPFLMEKSAKFLFWMTMKQWQLKEQQFNAKIVNIKWDVKRPENQSYMIYCYANISVEGFLMVWKENSIHIFIFSTYYRYLTEYLFMVIEKIIDKKHRIGWFSFLEQTLCLFLIL